MYHVPLALQCIYGCSDEGGENGDGEEERRYWRLPDLFYANDLVLCGESEEDLRAMVGRFVKVCRRYLKVNAGKSKVMVLSGEERLYCEVCVDRICLGHVLKFSKFKYLGCVLNELGTDGAECSKNVANGRRITGAVR